MAEEQLNAKASSDEAVLQQQYLRALSSFEGIVLSQIDVKNKLGDRLNYSIRTGLIILIVIAFSILVLLLTLSSQINRISGVVGNMNTHFTAVSGRMDQITLHMASMERQVALLDTIDDNTTIMQREMVVITNDMDSMYASVSDISTQMSGTQASVGSIALTINLMNLEVQAMSNEMHRMAKPARTINKLFPFP